MLTNVPIFTTTKIPSTKLSESQKIRSQLVLLHPENRRSPTDTWRWLDSREVAEHIHLRPELARWRRLARLISRTTVGLALSGGGARGFAHLGVLKALDQAGIAVDQTAGTSIGAVMAATSMDMSIDDIIEVARTAFAMGPTEDFNVIPMISLIGGKRACDTRSIPQSSTVAGSILISKTCGRLSIASPVTLPVPPKPFTREVNGWRQFVPACRFRVSCRR